MVDKRVVVWFSCGVASAVASKVALDTYRDKAPVHIVAIDTKTEHSDNWRFADDVSNWLDYPIERISNDDYENCNDVYESDGYLVGVRGARCSLMMKKKVRQGYENLRTDLQVFGYDASEVGRSNRFVENNPELRIELPLIDSTIHKGDCHRIISDAGIARPVTYDMGFPNANCLHPQYGGCVKASSIKYWQRIKRLFPDAFAEKARIERELDVAICKRYINGERTRVFLDEIPASTVYDAEPEVAVQCGLFCGFY